MILVFADVPQRELVGLGVDGFGDDQGGLAIEHPGDLGGPIEGGADGEGGAVGVVGVGAVGVEDLDEVGDLAPPPVEPHPGRQIDQHVLHRGEVVEDPRVPRVHDHLGVVPTQPPVEHGGFDLVEPRAQRVGDAHAVLGDARRDLGLPGHPGRGPQPELAVGGVARFELGEEVRLGDVEQRPHPFQGHHPLGEVVDGAHRGVQAGEEPSGVEERTAVEHVFECIRRALTAQAIGPTKPGIFAVHGPRSTRHQTGPRSRHSDVTIVTMRAAMKPARPIERRGSRLRQVVAGSGNQDEWCGGAGRQSSIDLGRRTKS